MKIAYFVLDKTDYGSPNNELKQANFFAKAGAEVYLYTEGKTDFEDWDKSKNLHCIKLPIVAHVTEQRHMTKEEINVILNNKVDVIFGSAVSASPLTIAIGKMMKVNVVNQVLDVPMFRLKYKKWMDQWTPWLNALMQSDLLIVNTRRAAQDLHNLFKGTLDSIVRIVYYGIDDPLADSIPDQKKEYDICCVGRLVFYKYHDILLYALIKLKQEGIEPKTVIVGDGEEAFRLQEICINAGLNVKFVGAISDEEKFKIIKQSRIAVYPDCCESITGLFPAEAMYCDLPTIITDMPINRERFGDAPIYVPKFDVQAFAEEIKKVLEYPIKYIDRIEQGKKFVKENRRFDQTASGILNAMEGLIKSEKKI